MHDDPLLEEMIAEWYGITSEKERIAQTTKIQQRLFEMMPVVPLGLYSVQTAFRSDLTGYLQNSTSVPWNIRRV